MISLPEKRGLNIVLNRRLDFSSLVPGNGNFEKDLHLPEGVRVFGISELVDEDFTFASEDSVSKFMTENLNDSLFVTVDKGLKINKPISLRYSGFSEFFASQIFILCDEGCDVKINLSLTSEELGFCGIVVKVIARKNSKVDFVTSVDLGRQEFVQRKFISCEENAICNSIDSFLDAGLVLSECKTYLNGKNAAGNYTGLFISRDRNVFDVNSEFYHNAHKTHSHILTQGISLDSSQSVSRGLINISENTRGCDGYEKHNVLLLGNEAEADAIPQLEILNDDVTCSHGTSIGTVDEMSIFYLMSRGLSKKEAELELLKGFLFSSGGESLSEALRQEIYKKLVESIF